MPKLSNALRAWNTVAFEQTLKSELEQLESGALPLHIGATPGGHIDDSDIQVTVLRSADAGSNIEAQAGIFFTEIMGGCSCGDDPMPTNAYCEIRILIDKTTAEADIRVLRD